MGVEDRSGFWYIVTFLTYKYIYEGIKNPFGSAGTYGSAVGHFLQIYPTKSKQLNI